MVRGVSITIFSCILTSIAVKHVFLDLDAVFSVGFIFVLVEAVNPRKSLGFNGIDRSHAILRYLVILGNHAASKRLAEIDQMCAYLSLSLQAGDQNLHQSGSKQTLEMGTSVDELMQPFSFTQEHTHLEPMQALTPAVESDSHSDLNALGRSE